MAARFSGRIPWHLPPNRLSVALAHKRATAPGALLDLTVSNPTRALPEVYDAALVEALADPRGLRYEPTPQGAEEARAAVAAYYAERGLAVSPERLVLCASTSEAYTWLFQLLCDPGDRVLFPQPSYPLLEMLGGLAGVAVDPYPLRYDGSWYIDLAALAEAVQPRTRAVVLVSPNNPTGSFVHSAELQPLLALCRQHGLALIVDEVFSDYPLDADAPAREPRLPSLLELPRHLGDPAAGGALCFVLSGLSKVVGLPQLKLGWIHVGGPEPLRTTAQDRLELIADTFLSVGTPVQLAAPRLLQARPRIAAAITARVAGNLAALRAQLADSACQVLPVEGGWYAVLRLPRLMSEEEWVLTLLDEDDVLCHPGYFFDFAEEAYLVVSLLTPPEVLSEAVQRLLRRVAIS